MALTLTGINTGVIRNGNQFQALALNLKHEKNETSLIFIPALQLRDLYICFEHRLHLQNQRNAKEKAAFKKSQDTATQTMLKNIPPLTQKQLLEADIRLRVEKLEPHASHAGGFQLVFSLQGGHSLLLELEDAQIALVISAISHAINNAGMHKLSLRISSLLDFLPMYDADIKSNGEMEYDNYPYPAWKLRAVYALSGHWFTTIPTAMAGLRMRHHREIPHSGRYERDRGNGPAFTGVQPAAEKAGRKIVPYHRGDYRIRRGSLSARTLPESAASTLSDNIARNGRITKRPQVSGGRFQH
ncbi:YjeJ family protein [Citrobacter enshiensis]|nr:YjeJ family protein [Citrobacter enshiensis]WET40282.1 YjeJ family protein [Citrobacter enshiensis]